MITKAKKSILLVEDEVLIAFAKKQELKNYGYDVLITNTGEKAVAIVKENESIDLILMDIDLGRGIDGTQAAELILEGRELPVVFLSSHTEPEVVEKTEKITSYGYVVKNSCITVLDASIKMAFKLFYTKIKEKEKEKALKESEEKFRILTVSSPVGKFLSNAQGNVNYINEKCAELIGKSAEGMLRFDLVSAIHPDDREMVTTEWLKTTRNGGEFHQEYRWLHKDGKVVWTLGDIVPVIGNDGEISLFIGTLTDITKRKQLKNESQKNQYLLTKAQELGNVGTWEMDIQQNIIRWTDEAYRIFDVPPGTEITRNLVMSHIHPDDRAYVIEKWNAALNSEPFHIEFRLIVNDTIKWVRDIIDIDFDKTGNPITAIGFVQDITDSKEEEITLHQYKHMVSSSTDMQAFLDRKFNYIAVNTAYSGAFHLTPEQFIGRKAVDIFGEEYFNNIIKPSADRCLCGEEINFQNWYDFPVYGRQFIDITYFPYRNNDNKVTGYVVNRRNITKNKQAALMKSVAFFNAVVEDQSALIYRYTEDGTIVFVNNTLCEYKQMISEELIGANIFDVMNTENVERAKKQLARLTRANPVYTHEHTGKNAKGEKGWFQWTDRIVFSDTGEPLGYQGIGYDITKIKKAEEEIKRQLSEKEVLLKEVHHRIKNNFAFIGSFLSIQVQSISNTEAISALQDAIGRVNSMQVLYKKLLITDDYQDISTKEYLDNLIDEIIDLFSGSVELTVQKQIVDYQLEIKQLSPIGIIVNELLTNIMKYAFTGRDSGIIEVTLKEDQGNIALTIQDNGNGLPEGFEISESKGFGLLLVKVLTEQLRGNIVIENNNGTKTTLEFSI